MNIYIGSDHAGFELKAQLVKANPHYIDLGTHGLDSVDFPDYANLVCEKMKSDPGSFGILVCGSGQGMALRPAIHPRVAGKTGRYICVEPGGAAVGQPVLAARRGIARQHGVRISAYGLTALCPADPAAWQDAVIRGAAEADRPPAAAVPAHVQAGWNDRKAGAGKCQRAKTHRRADRQKSRRRSRPAGQRGSVEASGDRGEA